MLPAGAALKDGFVQVRKHASRLGKADAVQWKRRWLYLRAERLFVLDKQVQPGAMPSDAKESSVLLAGAKVSPLFAWLLGCFLPSCDVSLLLTPPALLSAYLTCSQVSRQRTDVGRTTGSGKSCLVLECKRWTKHGKEQMEPRDYVMALPTEDEREQWIYMLQFAIEGQKQKQQLAAEAARNPS
jgi:hypothetical protein